MGGACCGIDRHNLSIQNQPFKNEYIKEGFQKMDKKQQGKIFKNEMDELIKSKFGKKQINIMFTQIDLDNKGYFTLQDWIIYWNKVMDKGYGSDEIQDEINELVETGQWCNILDQNNFQTNVKGVQQKINKDDSLQK